MKAKKKGKWVQAVKTNKMKCWIARSLAVLVFLLVCGGYFYFFGGTRTTVLMYHHIVSEEELQAKWIGNNAVISDVQFEEEMKYLHDEGYTTLLPSEVARMYEVGEALPEQCVVVTFDDGYESNYLLALPILQKYFISVCKQTKSPYDGGDTSGEITRILTEFLDSDLSKTIKTFYDV